MTGEVEVKSQETEKIENRWYNKEGVHYGLREAIDYNILHNYRSYNYIITLAALSRADYNDPEFFKTSKELDYQILKSSGKGGREIGIDPDTYLSVDASTENQQNSAEVQEILEEYNLKGAGRLDLYIDNLEITSSWNMFNGSVPGQIRFDVIEPWSVNGFIEAIRINALAAGYPDHRQATFVLKIEFIGYKDSNESMTPEIVPMATRCFPININQIAIETTERGTVYKVACAPRNATALSEDGKLATTVKMVGSTVGEVLNNLAKQLTTARKQDTGKTENEHYNEYKIKWLDGEANEVSATDSIIGSSEINTFLRDDQVFSWPTPADENPKSSYKGPEKPTNRNYDSTKGTVSFGSQHSILDVIVAVIRDSAYTKELLGKLEDTIKNNNGLVNWFRVYVNTEIKPSQNDATGNLNYIYTYVIRPFKFHYSRLPGMGKTMFDGDALRGQIKRTYQYLYSGQNVDILKFDLKLNNLYAQQRPYRFGEKDTSGTAKAVAAAETAKLEEKENPVDGTKEDQQNIPIQTVVANNNLRAFGPQGNSPQASPYQVLGQILHETLLDSADFYMLDLHIVGDPYYLVTAAIGNQEEDVDPETKMTVDGAAPYLGGNVFIDLYFRNPKDIKPDGWADFGDGLLPFSGIFQVNQATHTFREGRFEQRLKGVRLPGQLVNDSGEVQLNLPSQQVKDGESKTIDTAPGSVSQSGARPSVANVLNMLNRGLPTNGLPGILSNFNNVVGGALGGINTSLQTTLSRVDEGLANALSPVNSILQAGAGVVKFAAQVGGLVAAGQALINGFDSPGGAPGLGQKVGGYNPYTSGLRLDVNGLQNLSNGQDRSNLANVEIQTKVVSTFVQDSSNIQVLKENYFKNDLSQRTSAGDTSLNNAGNNINSIVKSTKVDPKAVAQAFGIDPAQLSGMSSDQQSSIINKLLGLASKIPENTDIAGLKALGISLANIPGARLANLPALQPLTTAPLANIPAIDLQKIIASGGNPANLPGASSIPAVAALIALLNKDKGVPNNGITGGQGPLNATSVFDKLQTAENLSVQLSKQNGSVEANVANINYRLQGYAGYYQVTETAYSKYGTNRTDSPIDKLMQTKV